MEDQTPLPSVPPTPKHSFLLPFLSVCAVFLIVLLIGAGGFILGRKSLSQTKTEVPAVVATVPTMASDGILNWKTYSNPKLGMEFRYPSEFTVSNANNIETGIWISNPEPYAGILIETSEETPKNLLLEDGISELNGWKKSEIKIDNIKTDVYSGYSGEGAAYPTRVLTFQWLGNI